MRDVLITDDFSACVVEVKGSHAIYVSQPRAVADLIEQAATKTKAATA
jgi:hypothetical protein